MSHFPFSCSGIAVLFLGLFLWGCQDGREEAQTVAQLKSFLVLAGDTRASLSWEYPDGASLEGVHIFWGTNPDELTESQFVAAAKTELEVTGLTNGQNYAFAAELQSVSGVRSARGITQFARPFEPDTEAPSILLTSPVDGASAVDSLSLLSVTFSEPMDVSSIVISLNPARALNPVYWNEEGSELVTGPQTAWKEGESYEAKITGTDASGNPISGVDVFSFTVAYQQLAPEITGTSPDPGLSNVPTNTRVTVTFAEPMEPISTHRALSTSPGVPMSYEHDSQQQTFTWIPQAALDPDTTYTVTLGASARNMRGELLGDNLVFDFTTVTGPDETAPTISSFLPEDDALGQERNFELAIAFSEAMDHAWTQAALVFPSHPGMSGTYTWSNGGTVMRFTPEEGPEYGEVVSWQLLGQAKDLAGNPIAADTLATFKVLRLETETIYSDPSIDGTVAIFDQAGEWGSHWIETDEPAMHIGSMGYTNFGPSLQRAFYSFDLSVLPEDLTRIHQASIKHAEIASAPACSQIGFRYLESVPIGPELTVDDFDVPTISFDFCYPEGDCGDQPFYTWAPCNDNWYWGWILWTSWVTPAVQNDWDDRMSRMHLSQWRIRIEMESTDMQRRRVYISNHPQVEWEMRPRLVVHYLVP